jgi:hypothetical protein
MSRHNCAKVAESGLRGRLQSGYTPVQIRPLALNFLFTTSDWNMRESSEAEMEESHQMRTVLDRTTA